MISVEQVSKYCSEPIELIENYDKAISDTKQIWDCHHRWETDLGYSVEELIEMGEYYKTSAKNLIFLTHCEHSLLHRQSGNNPMLGKHHTEESRRKMSESGKGRSKSEEHKRKISVSMTNGKLSKCVLQYTLDGEFVREWVSTIEVQRQTGFKQTAISRCALGGQKTAYNYIWKYKE